MLRHQDALQSAIRWAAVPAILASGSALAQSPIQFDIDSNATQFSYTGTSSLGALNTNPSSFTFTGSLDASVGSAAGLGIETIELTGSNALVTPDLNATVGGPFPLPTLATVDVVGLTVSFTAPVTTVDLLGNFTASVTSTVTAGTATVSPLFGAPSVIDLTGQTSIPQNLTGMIMRSGGVTTIGGSLTTSFSFTDPGTGASATIDLMGNLVTSSADVAPTAYCQTTANSSGSEAMLSSMGSPSVSEADLVLDATLLPPNQFCLYFLGEQEDFIVGFGGSEGNLCVGGSLVRLNQFIQNAGAAGQTSLAVPFDQPLSAAGNTISPGETWYFQVWFRDIVGGMQTSNTTNGVRVTFAP